MLYAIVTIAIALTLIIALGPVMHIIQTDMLGTLEREDTVFRSEGTYNSFMDKIRQGELVWEMSFSFFIFIAILFMILRGIKKQSYTQYDKV